MTNSSLDLELENCMTSIRTQFIFTSWVTAYLLFLPVFLFVLYIGFNKWKNPQSSPSGSISHSDVFTFNMVAMEMSSIVGSCVACYAFFSWDSRAFDTGGNMITSTSVGQVLFHSLTCVERYLAVVHPVTYMRLRRGAGVTIRNISIAFVWIFSLVYSFLIFLSFLSESIDKKMFYSVAGFVLSTIPVPLVMFCSVSVLCVLIRPKPGEVGGQRKQIDQSKRTTVYTMMAILGVLLLRLNVNSVNYSLYLSLNLKIDGCVMTAASLWSGLPSSLVLPLLFLYRAGKLPGCRMG